MSDAPHHEDVYPGQRLGLPPAGPGSVASWGRRIAALVIDWIACVLVARALFGSGVTTGGAAQFWTLGVLVVEGTLGTALAGGTFGHLVMRLAVVRLDSSAGSGQPAKPVGLLQALVRMVLICLVVPPLIFNRDNRGVHDFVAGTVVIRR